MSIDHDDVRRLVKILDRADYGSVSLDSGGVRIEVDWVNAATDTTGPVRRSAPEAAAGVDEALPVTRFARNRELRVTSPAVGRLAWKDGVRPSQGAWVDAGDEVGAIEAGERRTAVIVSESGRIAFVREYSAGDLVSFGQWLLVVDTV